MVDDITVATTSVAQNPAAATPPAATPAENAPAAAETKPAEASVTTSDDFDENQIPEASRDNFRKYRESQKAKASEYEKKLKEESNRLNEETRKRMEYESRWKDYETRQRAAQQQPTEAGPKPDYKNYSTIEEYTDALEKWKEADAINKYKGTLTQQQQQQKAQEEASQMQIKGNAARAKYADFDQVVRPITAVANQIPILVQFIKEFDNGTDVLYHLGKNPAALEALTKLQPFAAGQELLRIQGALSAPAPKAVTKAPEPMTPVNSGGDGTVKSVLELVKKDDVTDYVARENRKELRKRKGSE